MHSPSIISIDSARHHLQDIILDRIASGDIESGCRSTPVSLNPDHRLSFACAMGNPIAHAVRDAWAFRAPVLVMDAEELAALSERAHTVFVGREGDVRNE